MRVGFSLFFTALLLGVFACAGTRNLQADTVISAQFECGGNCFAGATPYSGVEPDAAGADSQFNHSNVWNHLTAQFDTTYTNQLFSPLVDSTGHTTAVSLTISHLDGGYNQLTSGVLPNTYFYSHSNSSFTISGLTPNESFTLFLYAYLADIPGGPALRNATFTIGSQSFDTVSASASSEDPDYAVDGAITGTTDASGEISGTWDFANTTGEIDWSGFQLDVPSTATPVPEPATWFLLGIGLAACLLLPRKKAASTKHFRN